MHHRTLLRCVFLQCLTLLAFESSSTVGIACRTASKNIPELFRVADLRKMQENQWVLEIRIDKLEFIKKIIDLVVTTRFILFVRREVKRIYGWSTKRCIGEIEKQHAGRDAFRFGGFKGADRHSERFGR